MEQKKRTYIKRQSPEPEREWEFEYGKNPPTMDDMVRYVRYIFEGRFRGHSFMVVYLLIFLVALMLLTYYLFF